nr:hybrid sensor histidine kinase/response regulator [Lysobacter sp. CAU 1642]
MQRCVATMLLGLWTTAAFADTPLFRQLGAAEGLPSERVYTLAQDLHGCLWVGTADGLARFDGSRFEVFHHDPRREGSLPSNIVQALHLDGEGRLWAGFEGGGLAEVHGHGQQLRRWRDAEGLDVDADVWAIASGEPGEIYFGGFGTGLVRIDPETGERRHWGSEQGLLSDHILGLVVDPQHGLWVASYGGLQRLRDGVLETPQPEQGAPPPGPVFSLTLDQGVLLIGNRDGVYRHAEGRFERVDSVPEGGVLSVAADAEGALWVGRLAGLDLVPAEGAARPALSAARRSGRRTVMELLRDHENGLWVASEGGGLLHLPPQWRRFRSWQAEDEGLQTAEPSAAAFDADGRLWTGGNDGRVERIDPATGASSTVLESGPDWPDKRVTALLPLGDVLFVGTRRGLVRRSLDGQAATRVFTAAAKDDPDAPTLGAIDHLLAARDGSLWMSVYGGGIEQRDRAGRLLRRFTEAEGLAGLDSEQLRWGPDGSLWIAGGDGLQQLDPDSGRFDRLDALAGERVFGFAFDGAGRLWAARRDGLVWMVQSPTGWKLGGQLDLLSGIEVGGLAADAVGRLWANSTRGLWRIDPQRGTARRFGVRDGLPGQEFSDRPLVESADRARLAAVLPQAVVQVDSALFSGAVREPRLRLEPVSLRRAGQALDLASEPVVSLRYDDREIALAARVSSFVEPDAWRYRMRLAPFDPEWVELGGSSRRVFPLLAPGDYRLQVQAAGPDGEWHAHPPLAIEVQPPWWQLPIARAGQVLLGLLALALLLRAYRRRGEARAAAALGESQRLWALQASEQKSQFLATLAHEIRTPMTGLLGMAELLAGSDLDPAQRRQLEAVRRSGDLLRRLVDDALDLARIEAGRLEIRPRPMPLRTACQQALDTLDTQLRGKGLKAGCELGPDLPEWVEADPERLQQILLNLLSNALKFTEAGGIRLCVTAAEPPWIAFEVIDSGPGIDPAQRERLLRRFEQVEGEDTARRHGGAGLGLAISSELARAMGGSLTLDAAPGGGTCVRVRLPLPAAEPPAGARRPLPPARDRSSGLGILLVEDDALAAEAIQGLLAAQGHRTRRAAHALEALAELEQELPDLALLDLDLPGMDGLQLAALIRARHPGLPLLAVSARSAADTEAAVREAGMQALLRKPVDGAALEAALCEGAAACQAGPGAAG